MKPAPYHIEIRRGDTFELFFRVRQKNADGSSGAYINLTGSTPKAQVRTNEDAVSPIVEFIATLGDQTEFPGSVLLRLTPATTATLNFATAKWDVQVTDSGGDVSTYLAGDVTFIKDVTRA